MKTKIFTYPIYADGNNECDIFSQQGTMEDKINGIFKIVNISEIRHISFSTIPVTYQMRRHLIIEAPSTFTKQAIYIIMNSIKAQPLEFR